jgi:hypothetical protein
MVLYKEGLGISQRRQGAKSRSQEREAVLNSPLEGCSPAGERGGCSNLFNRHSPCSIASRKGAKAQSQDRVNELSVLNLINHNHLCHLRSIVSRRAAKTQSCSIRVLIRLIRVIRVPLPLAEPLSRKVKIASAKPF